MSPTIENIIEFLTQLFNSGIGYSAISTAKSALSATISLPNCSSLGEHPLIRRFMRGIFNLRPSLPKYTHIWDVHQVFSHLKTYEKVDKISLKYLTLKTVTLLALLTAQRCQTLHKLDLSTLQVLPSMIRISITTPLKTTRPGRHLGPIELRAYPDNPSLCIVEHLTTYIDRTKPLRGLHTELFLSYQQPHKPVTKDTIARWVKVTLKNSGIDTSKFSAHSCRSAATSATKTAGLSLSEIVNSAGWTNAQTFAKFYDRSTTQQDFGTTLLQHFEQ